MSRVKRLFKPLSLTLYSVCFKNERFIVCINMEKDGVVFQVALLLKVTKTNLVVTKLAAGGHKHDSKVLLDTRGGGGGGTQQSFKRRGSSQRPHTCPL